jgi:hypothetical protein
MHPETTILLASMRRDDLLRSGQRFTVNRLFPTRSTRKIRVKGARS